MYSLLKKKTFISRESESLYLVANSGHENIITYQCASLAEQSSPPGSPETLLLYKLTSFLKANPFKCHKCYFTEF